MRPYSRQPSQTTFTCPVCKKSCRTTGGLSNHLNVHRRPILVNPDNGPEKRRYTVRFHEVLSGKLSAAMLSYVSDLVYTAKPCRADGTFLPPHLPPPPPDAGPTTTQGWHPFESRITYDFAKLHYVKIQSSASEINNALNIWAASVLQYGGTVPWASAEELYATIDEIQRGDSPWTTFKFRYSGPLPAGTPPKWMTDEFELCTRNAHTVLLNQLASPEFKDQINMRPYQQFNPDGKRVYSNFMSGDHAWAQAVRGMVISYAHC